MLREVARLSADAYKRVVVVVDTISFYRCICVHSKALVNQRSSIVSSPRTCSCTSGSEVRRLHLQLTGEPSECFFALLERVTIGKPGIQYWSSQASGLCQVDCQTHAGRPNASRSAVLSSSTNGISPQVRCLRTCIGSGPEVSTPRPTRPLMLGRYPGPRGTR